MQWKVCVCASIHPMSECCLKYSWPDLDKKEILFSFWFFCRQHCHLNAEHHQLLFCLSRCQPWVSVGSHAVYYFFLILPTVLSWCWFMEKLADDLHLNLWLIRISNTSSRCRDVKIPEISSEVWIITWTKCKHGNYCIIMWSFKCQPLSIFWLVNTLIL